MKIATYLIYVIPIFIFNNTRKQMLNNDNLFKEEEEEKIELKM